MRAGTDVDLSMHDLPEEVEPIEVGRVVETNMDATDAADDGDVAPAETDLGGPPEIAEPTSAATPAFRGAMHAGVVVVAVLSVLSGWLGFRAYQSHQKLAEQNQFVQVARQGAVNLTTIDWQQAERDSQRILDGATGEFYDDFTRRSQPFIDVVKKVEASTVGTVTEAGLESETTDGAQVLVAVTVETSRAGVADQAPRIWRMRIAVNKVDDQMKVSNVEFVP